MTPMHTRVATAIAAMLFASAAANVATALAQVAPTADGSSAPGSVISTTCGAGTKDKCGDAPVQSCDFTIGFSFENGKGISFNFGRTNCKTAGTVPIYKDMDRNSSLFSGSCDLLAPFLGLPAGSGCSD